MHVDAKTGQVLPAKRMELTLQMIILIRSRSISRRSFARRGTKYHFEIS